MSEQIRYSLFLFPLLDDFVNPHDLEAVNPRHENNPLSTLRGRGKGEGGDIFTVKSPTTVIARRGAPVHGDVVDYV